VTEQPEGNGQFFWAPFSETGVLSGVSEIKVTCSIDNNEDGTTIANVFLVATPVGTIHS
jgi:hypothetical protein